MKKLTTIILCFFCVQSFAQKMFYVKSFPGNDKNFYYTNSKKIRGLVFCHTIAADTVNAVFYIENYKYSDVKIIPQKIKVMNAKLCLPGYKSKAGDFIFTMDSDQDIIFYYHLKRGKYRIKAETYQGKVVSKIFTKGPYAQNIDIEFRK